VEETKNVSGNSQYSSVTLPEHISSEAQKEKEESVSEPNVPAILELSDIRQSFIIREDYLDQLKDYVHMRKVQGNIYYTQKQALHESLDLLFKDAKLEKRPEKLRQKEDLRRDKIRQGKAKS